MFGLEKDLISFVLTDTTVKIAQIQGAPNAPRLVNIIKRDVKDLPPEELATVVQSCLSSIGVKHASAICCLPSSVAITKNIEIPSIDPAEIKSIIDLQAGRHTPFAREEIIIGYINIGVYQRNYTKILLIIINRQVVKQQLDILTAAGVKIEKVVFAPEGKASFYGRVLDLKQSDMPIGIIDIGKYTTDFNIELNSTVIACRSIPVGMENLLKEGQAARDKLIQELGASLESYQSEDISRPPETFVLANDDAKVKELEPLLKEKLKANVKVLPYLDHVTASQPVMLKIISEFDDESLLDCLAPVFAQTPMKVDLTPDEIKIQHSIEEKGKQIVMAGIFGTVLLLLICAIFFSKIYFRSQQLEALNDEFQSKHKTVQELEEISTNTKIIKDYLNSRMTTLEILKELYSKIPDEIYLKNVVLNEDGSIRVQGISESRSTAFAFITILEDSELFKGAKMISSSAQKDRGKDVSAFEISFRLESAKDEVIEEAAPEEAAADGDEEEKKETKK